MTGQSQPNLDFKPLDAPEEYSPALREEARRLLRALFAKSVLKQEKWAQIRRLLPTCGGRVCMDLGSDNGVISEFLRAEGGEWHSGDMSENCVRLISLMVETNVWQTDGSNLPLSDGGCQLVVVIDMLEHVEDEAAFVAELARVVAPGGTLIVNAPNLKRFSPIKVLRNALGQTDESHGHLRPGYNDSDLKRLFSDAFLIEETRSYSGPCTQLLDTLIVFLFSLLSGKRGYGEASESGVSKGLVISDETLRKYAGKFRLFSFIYPVFRVFAAFDRIFGLPIFGEGTMRITRLQRRDAN